LHGICRYFKQTVSATNTDAIALWRSFDFEGTGTIAKTQEHQGLGKWVDALMMF
jgi:hypothetical protein